MILTIDVGNTHTIIGVYDKDELIFTARMSTDRQKTLDEYAVSIRSILSLSDKVSDKIDGAIISSVVPQVSGLLEGAIKRLFDCKVFIVGP